MIKKLFGAVALLGVGYIIGLRSGFQTALQDYIENDGEMLERYAQKLSEPKRVFDLTDEDIDVGQSSEESDDSEESEESSGDSSPAFQ